MDVKTSTTARDWSRNVHKEYQYLRGAVQRPHTLPEKDHQRQNEFGKLNDAGYRVVKKVPQADIGRNDNTITSIRAAPMRLMNDAKGLTTLLHPVRRLVSSMPIHSHPYFLHQESAGYEAFSYFAMASSGCQNRPG